MAKMTENQLIDAIAEGMQVSKGDVKAVVERMVTVGHKELNESGKSGVKIRKAQPSGPGSNLESRYSSIAEMESFLRPSPQTACKSAWPDLHRAPKFVSLPLQTLHKLSLHTHSEAP
jgi:hypothetical protein